MGVPASYHNGAAGFTFADGHAEIHHWLDDSTVKPVTKIWHAATWPTVPNNRDIKWMQMHATPSSNSQ